MLLLLGSHSALPSAAACTFDIASQQRTAEANRFFMHAPPLTHENFALERPCCSFSWSSLLDEALLLYWFECAVVSANDGQRCNALAGTLQSVPWRHGKDIRSTGNVFSSSTIGVPLLAVVQLVPWQATRETKQQRKLEEA